MQFWNDLQAGFHHHCPLLLQIELCHHLGRSYWHADYSTVLKFTCELHFAVTCGTSDATRTLIFQWPVKRNHPPDELWRSAIRTQIAHQLRKKTLWSRGCFDCADAATLPSISIESFTASSPLHPVPSTGEGTHFQ